MVFQGRVWLPDLTLCCYLLMDEFSAIFSVFKLMKLSFKLFQFLKSDTRYRQNFC